MYCEIVFFNSFKNAITGFCIDCFGNLKIGPPVPIKTFPNRSSFFSSESDILYIYFIVVIR